MFFFIFYIFLGKRSKLIGENRMIHINSDSEKTVVRKVTATGQEHVFQFWNQLDTNGKQRLLKQLGEFDFALLDQLVEKYIISADDSYIKGHLEPVPIVPPAISDADRKRVEKIRRLGEKAIIEKQVAALVVAGGQGTRLGFDGPKGKFPAGPVTKKSLFQLYAEKIKALELKYHSVIPWYIMTSQQNDSETKEFFKEHDFFGLASHQVTFFQQGVMPALTSNGKLILDAKDHVFVNPDGHGGCLLALQKSGALTSLQRAGIRWLFYFQVDNVLVNICDPLFLGYHFQKGAEMSAKVVAKRDPYERVGVIGQVDGKVKIIEYSDLSKEEMEARNPDGRLKYNAGNIAIHLFNIDFLERLMQEGIKLPFHKAFKKIPTLDVNGNPTMPSKPNGYKFEMFVFDALSVAREVMVMEVQREQEFSPIKNATGIDSPQSAKQDMNNCYGRWLEQVGVKIPRTHEGNVRINIEISPLFAIGPEDLRGKLASDLKLTNDIYLR